MQYEYENPFSGDTHEFFPYKISAKSVMNTVKEFTKTLWLWKSGTKASEPHVRVADYWWTVKRDVPDAKHRRVISLYILEDNLCLFH
jgi:hypothetical protein